MAAVKRRLVFRVLPLKAGRWEVRKNSRQWLTTYGKRLAVWEARVMARAAWKRGKLTQLVVHRRDGTIEFEHTYGRDPERFKG